jgi:hypothetical protein
MEHKEKWLDVCDQIAKEHDPKKLVNLTEELNRLLKEKHAQLEGELPKRARLIYPNNSSTNPRPKVHGPSLIAPAQNLALFKKLVFRRVKIPDPSRNTPRKH